MLIDGRTVETTYLHWTEVMPRSFILDKTSQQRYTFKDNEMAYQFHDFKSYFQFYGHVFYCDNDYRQKIFIAFVFVTSMRYVIISKQEDANMMYPFMQLDDGAEIVHSELLNNNQVKVYIEKPDADDGFHDMTCYLPSYEIASVHGFTEKEQARYLDVIKSTANLIMEFAKGGGFENASGF